MILDIMDVLEISRKSVSCFGLETFGIGGLVPLLWNRWSAKGKVE